MVTPFSAIYEQSRGAGSSDGEGATKDRRNVSQRCWSDLVLSHPQLSFDHAQAGPFHVGCTGCGLCRQAFACRLGTYVVTPIMDQASVICPIHSPFGRDALIRNFGVL